MRFLAGRRLRLRRLRRGVRPGAVAVAGHRGQHGHLGHPGHRRARACSPRCRWPSRRAPGRMGFSMGAIWVIPGLIVLPLVGAVSDGDRHPGRHVDDDAGVRWSAGSSSPAPAASSNEDIKQVWTMAAARSEVLYERRQGRVKLLLVPGPAGVLRQRAGALRRRLRDRRGRDRRPAGHQRRRQVDAAEGHLRGGRGRQGRGHLRRPRHHPRPAQRDRRRSASTQVPGRPGRVPVAHRAREPAGGGLARARAAAPSCAERTEQVLDLFPVLRAAAATSRPANLSGGQQQMLALGMAFLARPRLLLHRRAVARAGPGDRRAAAAHRRGRSGPRARR